MSIQCYRDLKKMLCKELDEMTYNGNGRINTKEDLEIIDLLTHSIKSIDTVIAMSESQYRGESGFKMPNYVRNSFGGLSSAPRRDSMGRYSRDTDMMADLHELMSRAKDEHTRMKFQRFIEDLEERD